MNHVCVNDLNTRKIWFLQRMLPSQFVNQDLTKLSFIISFAKDVNIKNRLGFHNQTYLDSQLLELNKNCN